MFLSDSVNTSPLQSLDVVAIHCFQRSKDRKITWLEFMGGLRGQTTETMLLAKQNSNRGLPSAVALL